MPDQITRPKGLAVKLLAASVCGLLVSWGLCGLDAHLYPHAEFGGSILASIGALLFVISALILVGSVLVLIVQGIVRLWRSVQE
jgi:hypothetical protein